MRLALAALITLAACGPMPWTAADTAGQVAVTATLAGDYLQTRHALDTDGQEHNPIMGPRGERVPPEMYFTVAAIGAFAVARELPKPWRNLFQLGVTAVQVKTIRRNWSAGYAVQW
jgi:hypothetical protein